MICVKSFQDKTITNWNNPDHLLLKKHSINFGKQRVWLKLNKMNKPVFLIWAFLGSGFGSFYLKAQELPEMGQRVLPDTGQLHLVLNINKNKPFVAGETAFLGIQVRDKNKRPLQGAFVKITASGGEFEASQNNVHEGRTSESGWFGSRWQVPLQTGPYRFSWQVQHPGFAKKEWAKEITVVPNPKVLKLQFSASPNPTARQGKARISVFVYEDRSGKKLPLKDADVVFNASEGYFPEARNRLSVSGKTDKNGRFSHDWMAPWEGNQSQLTATATKEDYPLPAKETIQVSLVERLSGRGVLKVGLKDPSGALLTRCTTSYPLKVVARHEASYSIYTGTIGESNCSCTIGNLPNGWYLIEAKEDGPGDAFYWME